LAMAIKAGGVWKHNQGLWAKSKSPQAAAYEKRVMQASIAAPALSRRQSAEQQAPRNFRGGRPFPLVAASAAERHFP
jgi:hypothetical protein